MQARAIFEAACKAKGEKKSVELEIMVPLVSLSEELRQQAALIHEEVEVRRVPLNRVVHEIPAVRKKGDTVIVPVVEEEIVVTKRLVLKEEVHLIKRRTKDRFKKNVELDRERAVIHRLDATGRVIVPPAGPRRGPVR